MDFSGVRLKVRETLQDSSGIRWTDSELDIYISEGAEEYARMSNSLEAETTIVITERGLYSVPANFLSFKNFTWNGNKLRLVSWQELEDEYGATFLEITGDPDCICFDLYSWNQFFLFPKPEVGAEDGTLRYSRKPNDGELEVQKWHPVYLYTMMQSVLRDGMINDAEHYLKEFNVSVAGLSHSGSSISYRGRVSAGVFF